jgi:hypothetical protein
MRAGKLYGACLLLALSAGCSSLHDAGSDVSKSVFGSGVDKPLLPDRTVALSSTTSIALEKLVYWGIYIGVAYMILDPLAPNWDIEEARLDPQLVHFDLKMKRYYAGGAGEARQVFNRRAKALVRAGDFASYQIVEYNESLDSSVLGGQRRAEGVIRLIPKL